jgi:LysM repeat protein
MFAKTVAPMISACFVAIVAGCETLGSYRAAEEARWQADVQMLQENIRKVEGRVEGVEIDVERLGQSVESMRAATSRDLAAQIQRLQTRLDELEARVARVDAAREKDKQELIDRLGAKISEIMARSAPRSTTATTTPQKKPSQKAAMAGYEHEVKPGETLSAIAAAYGVSVKAILDNNDIKDPNRLRAGQKLFIPE